MWRFRELFFPRKTGLRNFPVGNLNIIGEPSASHQKRRALLLADSYGPTLQVNFLRPLTGYEAGEGWGTWSITEDQGQSSLESGESIAAAAQDLERVIARLNPTVIVASRYGGTLADAIVRLSRANRIPLITHLDDNLFEVPPAEQPTSRHGSLERQARLKALLAAADLDLISTAALHQILDRMGALGPRSMVVGIAGAAPILGALKEPSQRRTVFGYMGTRSHAADLAMVAPAIIQLLQRHPEARFELFGSIAVPCELSGFNIRHHAKIRDYDGFLRRLASLDWAFGLAPLQVTPFTLAKTNIKWIEYTAAGIPVIASDHPIYRECCAGGAGILAEPDAWYAAMSALVTSAERRAALYAVASARLVEEYSPARMHRQLMEAFATAGVSL
jgi:glycosyltransferase involved in cell wall biosynthesis